MHVLSLVMMMVGRAYRECEVAEGVGGGRHEQRIEPVIQPTLHKARREEALPHLDHVPAAPALTVAALTVQQAEALAAEAHMVARTPGQR